MGAANDPKIEFTDVTGFLVKKIGHALGIKSHDETFSDIQISNLLTEGVADKSARRTAMRGSGGDAMTYMHAYREFQRDYRRKYSAKFLSQVGYNPSSTANAVLLSKTKVETYVLNTLGGTRLISFSDAYLGMDIKVKYALQDDPNYDNVTGVYTINGYTYTYYDVIEINGTTIDIIALKDYYATQVEYLTLNYSYNESTNELLIPREVTNPDTGEVTIVYDTYTVDEISSNILINGSSYYIVNCVDVNGTLPNVQIEIPIETETLTYTNSLFDDECTIIAYEVDQVTSEWKFYLSLSDTGNFYETIAIDMTAIIPLKENNVIIDLNDRKLKRMLRKLNLGADQLVESLQNPDMDGAYLMTGISPTDTGPGVSKTIFQMFDLLSAGSGDITISISQLSMQYKFTMTKDTKSGSLLNVGEYQKINSGETMTLRYQGSVSQYREIVITNFAQNYTISGEDMHATLTSGPTYCRLVIPLDVLNGLKYKEFVEVYEKSLNILAFSTETIRVKWYESGAFSAILSIVSVVLSVVTWGAWGILVAAIMPAVVKWVAKTFGGVLGAVLMTVLMVVVAIYTGYYDSMSTTEVWIDSAQKLLNTVNQGVSMETATLIASGQEEMEELYDKITEFQDKLKELEEQEYDNVYGINMFDSAYTGTPNPMFNTTEAYVNSIIDTGAVVEWQSDYSSQISSSIERRNSTLSGRG